MLHARAVKINAKTARKKATHFVLLNNIFEVQLAVIGRMRPKKIKNIKRKLRTQAMMANARPAYIVHHIRNKPANALSYS